MQTPVKNLPLSPAMSDLGLGDMLQQQTAEIINQRKKQQMASDPVMNLMSPAAQMLFGGMK